jgi:hypothetical protein
MLLLQGRRTRILKGRHRLFFIGIVEHQQCHGISVGLGQPLHQQVTKRQASKPVPRLGLHVPCEAICVSCSLAEGQGSPLRQETNGKSGSRSMYRTMPSWPKTIAMGRWHSSKYRRAAASLLMLRFAATAMTRSRSGMKRFAWLSWRRCWPASRDTPRQPVPRSSVVQANPSSFGGSCHR